MPSRSPAPAAPRSRPTVPTRAGSGATGVELPFWMAACAPAGTPPATVQRLHHLLLAVCRTVALQSTMSVGGTTPFVMPTDAMRGFQADETAKWGAIIRAAGIQAESRLCGTTSHDIH